MATYTVHVPAARSGETPSADKIVFLRDRFSWWAFLFGPLWLLWNRAYLAAAAWFALLLTISVVAVKLDFNQESMSLISLALGIILGFEGSRLVAWTLRRRGYDEAGVVSGDSLEEAEEIFFHDWKPQAPPSPASSEGRSA
ncbi:MAG TPA: DUF2628 domain-containing protein [Methylocystis sp.]|nr:DUF2628 domain-containing protein [Methylocystis sp.]